MADPSRLLKGGASEFESRILSAGRRDAPSRHSRERILAGLGVGASLSTGAALTAKAATLGWYQRFGRLALGSVGIGAVGGAAVWAGVNLFAPAPAVDPGQVALNSPAPTAHVSAPVNPVAETEPAARPGAVEDASLNDAAKPATRSGLRSHVAGVAPESSGLSEELSVLESARRALVGGDARRTLRLLDEYSHKFAKPRLNSEASVLRIEALVQSGNRARALELGREFLSRHAGSPYERRVRSLIGDNKAPTAAP